MNSFTSYSELSVVLFAVWFSDAFVDCDTVFSLLVFGLSLFSSEPNVPLCNFFDDESPLSFGDE